MHGAFTYFKDEDSTTRCSECNEIIPSKGQEGEAERKEVANAKELLDTFTDEQRCVLFSFYCNHCGSKDPRCQCWNDD
jgi:hypothetical protein